MSIVKPIIDDSGKWPRKLEPRESVSAYGLLKEIEHTESLHLVTKAYAGTSCGEICTGSNQSLVDLVKWGKSLYDKEL